MKTDMLSLKKRITLFTLLFLIFSAGNGRSETKEPSGIITGSNVKVFSLPESDSNVQGTFERGDRVRIVTKYRSNDAKHKYWYYVRTGNKEGYVPAGFLELQNIGFDVVAEKNVVKIINLKENRTVFSDTYSGEYGEIVKSEHGRYVFVALMETDSCDALYAIIYDSVKKSLTARINISTNPSVQSVSPSGRYIVIDSGTAASIRELYIVDTSTGKIIHENVYASSDDIDPVWEQGDSLTYYISEGQKVKGKPVLEYTGDGTPNTYIRKVIWKNNIVTKTDIYKKVYME